MPTPAGTRREREHVSSLTTIFKLPVELTLNLDEGPMKFEHYTVNCQLIKMLRRRLLRS
jgi:hypothetical protein